MASFLGGAVGGAFFVFLYLRSDIRALMETRDWWREMYGRLETEVNEWKERAKREQIRADLALDRLTQLVAAAPPVSQPGKDEHREAQEKMEQRRNEMNEIFASETESPLREVLSAEPIV